MSKLNNACSAKRTLRSSLMACAILCFVTHLTGCGGGGGESASTAQTPLPPPPPVAFVPSLTLFAGALGGAGNTDGLPGRLNAPGSVAVDSSNNIYIGDGGNCNIRKLSTSGLSVFMGGCSCQIYADDGTASNSTFKGRYIITDRIGALYLAKYEQFVTRVARLESNGTLTELPVAIETSSPSSPLIPTAQFTHMTRTEELLTLTTKVEIKTCFQAAFRKAFFQPIQMA